MNALRSPRAVALSVLLERLVDARQRRRVGLELADEVLDELLEDAAELVADAEEDVQLLFLAREAPRACVKCGGVPPDADIMSVPDATPVGYHFECEGDYFCAERLAAKGSPQ